MAKTQSISLTTRGCSSLTLSQEELATAGCAIKAVAGEFGRRPATISAVWRRYTQGLAAQRPLSAIKRRIKGNSGQRCFPAKTLHERVRAVEFRMRQNLRTLATHCGVSKSTLSRAKARKDLMASTNTLKPHLSPEKMAARLQFVLGFVKPAASIAAYEFKSMLNMVHVDEKWFYLAKINQKIYLVPGQTGPTRPMHSKRFIPKVMFLAAVAEPRTNVVTGERFDGKIGIWQFVEIRPAARKRKIGRKDHRLRILFWLHGRSIGKQLWNELFPP